MQPTCAIYWNAFAVAVDVQISNQLRDHNYKSYPYVVISRVSQ